MHPRIEFLDAQRDGGWSCDLWSHGSTTVLTLAGEIDLAVAEPLHDAFEQLLHDGSSTMVVDLRNVTFMDSTGIRELTVAWRAAQLRQQPLALYSPSDSVLRVLHISGLDRCFTFVDALPLEN